MNDVKLLPEQETILKSQVFDATHPGALLHDFALVLDYVGEKGVKAGGKYNLLPIDAIHSLDDRLARPMRLDLKRPQLRSHPYLQGLHLLFRSSGLCRVQGKGDKARLTIDPATLESWNQLNPTEQYFALLEAWLFVSSPEMVGGHDSLGSSLMNSWLSIFIMITREGMGERLDSVLTLLLSGYGQGAYNVALAELFGLITLAAPVTGDRYDHPQGLKITPFGKAMFTLLAIANEGLNEESQDEEMDNGAFGRLRPYFQEYFPAWQNSPGGMEEPPVQEGVYVFKVSLGRVWRRIALAHTHNLEDLLLVLLHSIEFDFDHLYSFEYRDELGRSVTASHEAADSDLAAIDVELGTLPLKPGQSMSLVYDFGDNWKFDVKLERIDPPDSVKKLPQVLESHGKAPEQYPNWE